MYCYCDGKINSIGSFKYIIRQSCREFMQVRIFVWFDYYFFYFVVYVVMIDYKN